MKKLLFRLISVLILLLWLALLLHSTLSYGGFSLLCKRDMLYEDYLKESVTIKEMFLKDLIDIGFEGIGIADVNPHVLKKYHSIITNSGEINTEWYLFKDNGHYLYIYFQNSNMPPYRLCLYKFYFAKGISAIESQPKDIKAIDNMIREHYPDLYDIYTD